MFHADYAVLVDRFPTLIPLPRIERPHRPGGMLLSDVQHLQDIPSRLVFGDRVDDSFVRTADGWSIQFRDGFGNGMDLSVADGRFLAEPFFLGARSVSVGPAASREALLQYLSLAGDMWNGVLKAFLEERYPVHVAELDVSIGSACYLPDGWLRTILVPVSVSKLETVLAFHRALTSDEFLGASQSGCIALQPNAINYVEGRAPEQCDEPTALTVRHLRACGTPLLTSPVREEGSDGTAAWTLRRLAYIYHCTCFMRDVPRVMERLQTAGLLLNAPDQCSAVVPAEALLAASQASWWSANRECRSTWSGFEQMVTEIAGNTDFTQAAVGIGLAVEAGRAHARYFELEMAGHG